MKSLFRVVFGLALLVLAAGAGAETLRCNGAIASEGDSKLSVLYKCGQPLMTDTFCAPSTCGARHSPSRLRSCP